MEGLPKRKTGKPRQEKTITPRRVSRPHRPDIEPHGDHPSFGAQNFPAHGETWENLIPDIDKAIVALRGGKANNRCRQSAPARHAHCFECLAGLLFIKTSFHQCREGIEVHGFSLVDERIHKVV